MSNPINNVLFAAIVLGGTLAAPPSEAAKIVQSAEIGVSPLAHFSSTPSFNTFDATLGTLNYVDFQGRFDATYNVEWDATHLTHGRVFWSYQYNVREIAFDFSSDRSTAYSFDTYVPDPLPSIVLGFSIYPGDVGHVSGGLSYAFDYSTSDLIGLALFVDNGKVQMFDDANYSEFEEYLSNDGVNVLPVDDLKARYKLEMTYEYTPFGVPEPATWMQMLLGIGAIGIAHRSRGPRVIGSSFVRPRPAL